tara:strand:- start:2133 stop:2396 length:264 start_codon:yes stop_codon:yes gene_type:complete
MIKNIRINWDNQKISFTFKNVTDTISATDFLDDMIGIIDDLKDYIIINYHDMENRIPKEIKVKGDSSETWINGRKFDIELEKKTMGY